MTFTVQVTYQVQADSQADVFNKISKYDSDLYYRMAIEWDHQKSGYSREPEVVVKGVNVNVLAE